MDYLKNIYLEAFENRILYQNQYYGDPKKHFPTDVRPG